MNELFQKLDALLAWLPFNGNKTTISLGIQFLLPILVSKFPSLIEAAPILDGISMVGLGAGLIHKGVKAVKGKAV